MKSFVYVLQNCCAFLNKLDLNQVQTKLLQLIHTQSAQSRNMGSIRHQQFILPQGSIGADFSPAERTGQQDANTKSTYYHWLPKPQSALEQGS